MTIRITGGHILNPATGQDEVADVYIADKKVAEISRKITRHADVEIDAEGCYVMPGFIDMHVHLRDPGQEYKEDIFSGMAAAAHGGYTTVLAMPNTRPTVDNADVVRYVHEKAAVGKCIRVLQVGAVTKGQKGVVLADIAEMAAAGSPAISEDGKSVMNANLYRDAMRLAAKLDIPVLAHCEDINLVNGGIINQDEQAKSFHMPGISNAVEDVIVARDILLAKETGVRLHLCHCSTADSVGMVRAAKEAGIRVSAEVCPHHFTLTSEDIPQVSSGVDKEILPGAGTNYKMNPPLRTKKDVMRLKEGLRDGVMDVISTDHAPHSYDEKNTTMKKAPFGIVGLETAAALTYTELVLQGYLTPMQMAEKMSYNPARLIPVDRGDIQPGKAADIVIFDPRESYRIDKETFASKGRNTPFDKRQVTGRVRYTICDGSIVYTYKGEQK